MLHKSSKKKKNSNSSNVHTIIYYIFRQPFSFLFYIGNILWSRQLVSWTHPPKGSSKMWCHLGVKILRCINFKICESSSYLFLHMVNLCVIEPFLNRDESWTNACYIVLRWWIFAKLYFPGIESLTKCFGKEVKWWFWWKSKQRWRW